MKCCVVGCVSQSRPKADKLKLTYHRCPKTSLMRKKWQKAIGLSDLEISDEIIVCSEHFRADDYLPRIYKKLNAGAIPSLYLPYISDQKEIFTNVSNKLEFLADVASCLTITKTLHTENIQSNDSTSESSQEPAIKITHVFGRKKFEEEPIHWKSKNISMKDAMQIEELSSSSSPCKKIMIDKCRKLKTGLLQKDRTIKRLQQNLRRKMKKISKLKHILSTV